MEVLQPHWTPDTVPSNLATLQTRVAHPSWVWGLSERRGAIDTTVHAYGFFDHLRAFDTKPDNVRTYFEAMNFFLREGFQEHSLVASVVRKWKVEDQYSAYCTDTAFEQPEFLRLLTLYNPSAWTTDNLADILSTLQAEESRMSGIRLLEMSNLFFNHVRDVVFANQRLLDHDKEHKEHFVVNHGVYFAYFAVVNFFFEKEFRDELLVERLFQQWNVQDKYYQHCVETGFWLQMVSKDSVHEGVREDNLDVVVEMFTDHLQAIAENKWGKDTFDTHRYIELLVHFERWTTTMFHGMTQEQKTKDCVYQFYTPLIEGVKQQWGIQHEYDEFCVVSGVLMKQLLTTDVDHTQSCHQFAAHLEAIVRNQHSCPSAKDQQEYFRVLFEFQAWVTTLGESAKLEKDALVERFLCSCGVTGDYQLFATERRGPPRLCRKGLVKNVAML
jgi:hypothetical protein